MKVSMAVMRSRTLVKLQIAIAAGIAHLFVVESGLQDHDVITVDQVDEAVFLADPPGPAPASM
jgi:hypothetical protein